MLQIHNNTIYCNFFNVALSFPYWVKFRNYKVIYIMVIYLGVNSVHSFPLFVIRHSLPSHSFTPKFLTSSSHLFLGLPFLLLSAIGYKSQYFSRVLSHGSPRSFHDSFFDAIQFSFISDPSTAYPVTRGDA